MIMQTGKTISELRQEMTRIRRLGNPSVTNYFNQCSHCEAPLKSWIGEAALVFMWDDNGVPRTFFYASDKEELARILALTEDGYCLDYVVKGENDMEDIFVKANYLPYAQFGRFVAVGRSEEAQEMDQILHSDKEIHEQLYERVHAECAKVEDAEEIDAGLRNKFDAYDSHFWDMETLRHHIREGWVYVVRENGKIIAASLYEIQGRKSYGAFMYNNGSVEVITSLLETIGAAMAKKGCIQHYCWMDLKNKRALRYNVKYGGLRFDGMVDYIYVKGGRERPKKG